MTDKGRDSVSAVAADAAGYIVTTERDQPGCVVDPAQSRVLTWTSVDGHVWREMPEQGGLGREIDQLFVSGRTLIGVGVDWLDSSSSGIVWHAPLPNVASDNAPPPSPIDKPGRQGC